jgi:integrase
MVDLAGGCGMRQGEVLGLAAGDVDFVEGVVHIVRQVKLINGRQVFALPKGGKTRTVPLPEAVAQALEAHIAQHPPVAVTLPWRSVDVPRPRRGCASPTLRAAPSFGPSSTPRRGSAPSTRLMCRAAVRTGYTR